MKYKLKKKYSILPPALIACLLLFLLTGGYLVIRYLKAQTFEERTTQLVEITSQVQINLDSALDSHWNYLTAAVNMLEQQEFDSTESVVAYISELEELLETDKYGSSLMLLDSLGNCHHANESHGYWKENNIIADGKSRYTFISGDYAYQGSYWTLVQKLDTAVSVRESDITFTHMVLLKDIQTLAEYYDSAAYGNHNETYVLKGNGTRMHDEASQKKTIQAYNVLKALEEMDGQKYTDISAALELPV